MHWWLIALYLFVAVVYVAALIWLTVRVVNRRERWAKWSLAAMLSLPILHLASWPAMAWLDQHGLIPDALLSVLAIVYYPASFTVVEGIAPDWLRGLMLWYLGQW